MKDTKREQLLAFYFGAVDETSRLELERKMLTDQEWVLDFLDLKRELEVATIFPNVPPIELFDRLKFRRPKTNSRWLALGVGGAVAASVLAAVFIMSKQSAPINAVSPISDKSVVLDLSSRAYGNLNVF